MAKLTPKQERFVAEFLVDMNATAAARRAGYSEKSAEVQGCRLLRNAQVANAVQRGIEAQIKRTGITADQVLAGLWREANLVGDGASHSARVSALAHLGKHLRLFVDRYEHSFKPINEMNEAELRQFLEINGISVATPKDQRG